MATRLIVRKIEIVQAIQSVHNDVPVVAGKRSYVRVYLNPAGISDLAQVTGVLSVRVDDGATNQAEIPFYEVSSSPLRLRQSMSLREQRLDWSSSLNFQLPDALLNQVVDQFVVFKLEGVTVSVAGEPPIEGVVLQGAQETRPIKVDGDPGMHCRILLFRHRDSANLNYIQPRQGEAEAIRRYVENAFPVANVTWSSVDIAAPRNFRALGPVLRESRRTQQELTRAYVSFFQYMLAIREQDMVHGRDARTLYLGLIADPSGRFGGAAMDSPQFAAPHVVAMTTADLQGDLGAHELAHVLGRRHPGIPDCRLHGYVIGQRAEPGAGSGSDAGKSLSKSLSKHGYLSAKLNDQDGDTHVGLDNRFNGLAPNLLAHDQHFDLMTYRYPKWVSDFTYSGLLARLRQINDKRFSGSEEVWTIIGEYDLKRKTGKIFSLAKGRYNTPMPATPGLQTAVLKLAWRAGNTRCVVTECVNIRDFAGLDGSSSVGVFQHSIGVNDDQLDQFRSIEGNDKSGATYDQLFDELSKSGGRLQLMVHQVIVDEVQDISFHQQRKIGRYLKKLVTASGTCVEPESSGDHALDEGGLQLHYSIDDGGYYLRYRWDWEASDADFANLCIVTSFACKRRRQEYRDEEVKPADAAQWETIAVNHRSSDYIWISPVFFPHARAGAGSRTNYGDDLDDIERREYGELFVSGAAIRQQKLTLKVSISVGFKTISEVVKLRFPAVPTMAIVQRRSAAGGYLPSPGSNAELDNEKEWYRDTVAD